MNHVQRTNPDLRSSMDHGRRNVRMDAISIEKNELSIFIQQFKVRLECFI